MKVDRVCIQTSREKRTKESGSTDRWRNVRRKCRCWVLLPALTDKLFDHQRRESRGLSPHGETSYFTIRGKVGKSEASNISHAGEGLIL